VSELALDRAASMKPGKINQVPEKVLIFCISMPLRIRPALMNVI
jgi:hypothetical protein